MEVNGKTLDILLHKVKANQVKIFSRIKQQYESIDEDKILLSDLKEIEEFIYDAIEKANKKEENEFQS